MKQYLLVLTMLLTLSTGVVNAQGKHRHHQQTTTVAVPADTAQQGVEAFSDTTALADTDTPSSSVDTTTFDNNADEDWEESWESSSNDPLTFWKDNIGWGIGGILLAIVIVGLVLLILLLPFIIVIMILRYFIKRHNDRVTLAEKAMENGQPIPEEVKSVDKQSTEYLWKRGIRNVAAGVGLVIMFGIWDSGILVGIGALVLCMGIGQLIISKTSNKKNDELS